MLSKNKIKKEDLKYFTNKKLYKDKNGKPKQFNFKNILFTLPLIPKIYFLDDDDNIGSKIINIYYTVEHFINKLKIIKESILDIIDLNHEEFKKVKVPRETFQLYDDNLILSDFKNLKNKDISKFYTLYEQNNFNLLQNDTVTIPTFYYIFEKTYVTENYSVKKYYLNLLNEYIKLKNELVVYLKNNIGLMSFKYFFNIDLIREIKMKQPKSKEKTKLIENSLKDVIIYNENNVNNNLKNSNNFKIGDHFVINNESYLNDTIFATSSNNQEGGVAVNQVSLDNRKIYESMRKSRVPDVAIKSRIQSNQDINSLSNTNYNYLTDTESSEQQTDTDYLEQQIFILIKIEYFDQKEKFILKMTNNKFKGKIEDLLDSPKLKYEKNGTILLFKKINFETDNSFQKKIKEFDHLYANLLSANYYKDDNKKIQESNVLNLNNSINCFVGSDIDNSLYNILKNSINTDYFLIIFLFNFINPSTFDDAIDIHFKIKEFIDNKIDGVDKIYDKYIEWYNKFIHGITDEELFSITSESNFKSFFNLMMKDLSG